MKILRNFIDGKNTNVEVMRLHAQKEISLTIKRSKLLHADYERRKISNTASLLCREISEERGPWTGHKTQP